ncbi:MAG: histidine kinase [Bacteroidota bacterium]
MLKPSVYLLVLLAVLDALLVFPQKQQLALSHLTDENGLSSNFVTDILHDDLGYVWIATREGLNRYDGRTVQVFNQAFSDTTALVGNDILCLDKDAAGNIWAGTGEGVLHRYDLHKGTFDSYQIPVNAKLPIATMWDIEVGADGNVWMALERGLACFDTEKLTFRTWRPSSCSEELEYKKHDVLYSLQADPYEPSVFWLGARYGLIRFDSKSEQFSLVVPPGENGQYSKSIYTMEVGPDSTIWYSGQYDGIFRFDPKMYRWEFYQNRPFYRLSARAILPISAHEVWVGGYNDGLKYLDTNTGRFSHISTDKSNPVSKGVQAVHVGPDGNLWIGTHQGMSRSIPAKLKFQHRFYELAPGTSEEQFVFPTGMVYLEEGQLFVNSIRGEKAYLIDPATDSMTASFNQLPVGVEEGYWNTIDSEMDGQGNIWVTSSKGLFQVDVENRRLSIPDWENNELFTRFHSYRIKADQEGNLWASIYPSGLLRVDVFAQSISLIDLSGETENDFPTLEYIGDLVVDSKNRLWVGGEPFVVMYDPGTGAVEHFSIQENAQDRLSYSWIYCLAVDPDDVIWVGYKFGGLDRLDINAPVGQRVTHFGAAEGLASSKVFQMDVDQYGDLWIATGNGLTRMSTKDFKTRSFFEKDGLVNNDLNKYWLTAIESLSNGQMFLGGPGYHTLFHPGDFRGEESYSKLRFNGLKVFDREKRFAADLNFLKELKLNYQENFFTFQFANLDFNPTDDPLFRYKLEGFDKDWRMTDEGVAPYTNVGNGEYRFRVQAAERAGNWNEQAELSIALSIAPPFWKTIWFSTLLAFCLLAGLLAYYRNKMRSIKKKMALKSAYNLRLKEAEMKALRSQMNPHFLFNSLNSIKNYIVTNDARSAANYLTKFSQLIRLILNNSKSQSIPLASELQALELYLQLEQMRFPKKIAYQIEVDQKVNAEVIKVPPLILQPYVENAIWHGLMHKPGEGRIRLSVFQKEHLLKVEITDDGVGRKKASAISNQRGRTRKSVGMQLTADRLRMNSLDKASVASVEIEDLYSLNGQPAGTKVNIQIPISPTTQNQPINDLRSTDW